MRRSYLWLLGLAVPFGCVNSSDNPKPNPPPGFDASTPNPPPAPPPPPERDAGPDVAVDAPLEPVTISVLRGATAQANVDVVFQDAQGAVIEALKTGTDGKASRVVPAGSMLTVAIGYTDQNLIDHHDLLTYVGVEPGDNLIANVPADPAAVDPTLTIDVPANPPQGTTTIDVYAGGECYANAAGATVDVPIYPGCRQGPTLAILALASDGTAFTGYSFMKGVATPTMNGTYNGLGAWQTSFNSFQLAVSNLDANDDRLRMQVLQIADGQARDEARSPAPTGGAASATFQIIPSFADGLQSEAFVGYILAGRDHLRTISKRVAATATSEAFDLSQLLPHIDTITVDESTVSRPLVTWTAAASLAQTDGGIARLQWMEDVDGATVNHTWSFVLPPGTMSVRAPVLPSGLTSWAPAVAGTSPDLVGFVESTLISDYKQLRTSFAAYFGAMRGSYNTRTGPIMPVNGTTRLTANGVLID
jgi:hypothetical protein